MNHPIILSTANARYSHSSMGLRCLFANLGDLQEQAIIIEHTIKDSPESMVNEWLSHNPKVVGLGVYIWNIEVMEKAIVLLKELKPEIAIIVGGPEVSYGVSINMDKNVDYIVQLEGEEVFRNLCRNILNKTFPKNKTIKANVLDTLKIKMPYQFYTDQDIKNRKIYVEASRGCAFKCQFCLSALDAGIRNYDLDLFLSEMTKLYTRGVRQFKFIDRTFNLNIKLSVKILIFFLELDINQDFFLHFEVIPDRLPPELKKYIEMFKPGVLQFEVGIQTLDKEVSDRIGRKQNKEKALENLTYLRFNTNAHLHVDLIIGLPGADINIFKNDLNELVGIGLQEVQVGILKLLKGTPIHQHIIPFEMNFDSIPPYEIISTKSINQEQMKELRAFHKYFDKFYNSGNFQRSMKQLFDLSNPFDEFFALSKYTLKRFGKTYGISLDQLCESLYFFLLEERKFTHAIAREMILKDILKKRGRKVPAFLKDYNLGLPDVIQTQSNDSLTRQSNHIID
jgi:radical SAM superfamily enzyme YgiQ (UPF0313 family)